MAPRKYIKEIPFPKANGSRAKQKLSALLDYKSKANIFLRNGQLLLPLRAEEQMTDNLVFEGTIKEPVIDCQKILQNDHKLLLGRYIPRPILCHDTLGIQDEKENTEEAKDWK